MPSSILQQGLLLDILSQDWFDWLAFASWLYDAWVWLGLVLFFILVSVIGFANHRLPSREGVRSSRFMEKDLGDNNRLTQILSQFSHHHDTGSTTHITAPATHVPSSEPTLEHEESKGLSGIYPVDDGGDALSVRLVLTRLAESSLDLQYYMWHDDASGRLLFHEVEQAAERGVRVRLLLDDNNTAGMDAVLQTLHRHPNIEIRLFNPFMNRRFRILGYLTALKRLNRRMHNKSFTVDNQITVFGGRNIGDEYFDVNEKMNFADLDVVGIGQIVDDISTDFDRYWNCAASFPFELIVTRQHLPVNLSQVNHKEYATAAQLYQEQVSHCAFLENLQQGLLDFIWVPVKFVSDPPLKALPDELIEQLPQRAQGQPAPLVAVASTTPQGQGEDNAANLISQIADTLLSPKQSLTIVSPYFVPSGKWAERFIAMAQRGIKLNILTNSLNANDVLAVHAGYIRYRQSLIEGQVNLFELKSKRSIRHGGTSMGSGSSSGSSLHGSPRHQRPSRRYRRQHRDRYRWINRSTASLHAKTFSVDGEKLFVGSFNFDPRSAALNTEMGAIIESPTLARQLDDMIEKWSTELSYVVTLHEQKLQWQDRSQDPSQIFTNEPDSNFRQRLTVWILGRLPIEEFL